jgi:sugar phosphate isomerase/epimerase
MRIGAMNHPANELYQEIDWIAAAGLDFLDLTLEPPCAGPSRVNPQNLRGMLEQRGLGVVGHTAYYLPLASPFEELRSAAVDLCRQCLQVFAAVGAKWMNIHPDSRAPLQPKNFLIDQNLKSLRELVRYGSDLNMGIMVENIPGHIFNSSADIGALLDEIPELGLHLDIGHCNLASIPNNAELILKAYDDRLRHVHLHDNKGGTEDLHLALGTGTIDMPRMVRALKDCGYDNTITLEVFSPDHHYLEYSRDVLRKLWESGQWRVDSR